MCHSCYTYQWCLEKCTFMYKQIESKETSQADRKKEVCCDSTYKEIQTSGEHLCCNEWLKMVMRGLHQLFY